MVDRSIAYRLSFYISMAVIMVFIVFIVAYFLFTQKLLRENIENKAIGLSSEVSFMINRNIASISEITSKLGDQIIYSNKNNEVEEFLKRVTINDPSLVAVDVYFDSTYSKPPLHYSMIKDENQREITWFARPEFSSPAELEVFQLADTAEAPGVTRAYISSDTKDAVISFYYPLYDEVGNRKQKIGHISSSISLKEMNTSIRKIDIGERGYSFIIDDDGTFLTHPVETRIFHTNLMSISQRVLNNNNAYLASVLSERKRGSIIAYPDILDYEKSWVYFSPIPQTQWYLVFIMPFNELYHELYSVTARMAILALLGIVLIFFLVTKITWKQIKPLSTITSKLSTFSSPFKLNTQNEVKQVANSLEYLKVWFNQYQETREADEQYNFLHNRDLQQASEIQQSLIKTTYPAFPNRTDIDVHAVYKPARIVSGDLFDYFFIDDSNLIFTIGDVSGSGVPAAIFMSVCQTVIKKNAHLRHPKKIVEKTNYELCSSNHHQYFLTLFLGILNVKTGILTFCNAAHTFPFVLKANGEFEEISSIHGLPLGLYSNKVYGAEQIRMDKGDTIILYTDGVYDALNENNITSGNLWVQQHLKGKKNLSAKETVDYLDEELEKIESTIIDDICLLAINYK